MTLYLCQGLVFPCCSGLSFTIRLFFTWHTSSTLQTSHFYNTRFTSSCICWHSPRQQEPSAILTWRFAKACGMFCTQSRRRPWGRGWWVSKQRANTRKMSRIISSLCRFFCFQRLECLMLSRHVSNLLPHFYNVAFFYSFYNADIKREFSLFPHGFSFLI